jgi:hypothetical protein
MRYGSKQNPLAEKKEPTPQELADAFAAQALKAALDLPLDGLNILDEIRRGFLNSTNLSVRRRGA